MGLLGISPIRHPAEFLLGHQRLLTELGALANHWLVEVKAIVPMQIAQYFYPDDAYERNRMEQLLHQRLAHTHRVLIHDSLAHTDSLRGRFYGVSRQIVLASALLINERYNNPYNDRVFRQGISQGTLCHEVIHGAFAAAIQQVDDDDMQDARNGIHLIFTERMSDPKTGHRVRIEHGRWLNEAVIESFRRTLTATTNGTYEYEVAIPGMLNDLSPGLRDRLVLAAIRDDHPDGAYGEVEALLGPGAIKRVESLLYGSAFDGSDWLDIEGKIIALLPAPLQAQARASLRQHITRLMPGCALGVRRTSRT